MWALHAPRPGIIGRRDSRAERVAGSGHLTKARRGSPFGPSEQGGNCTAGTDWRWPRPSPSCPTGDARASWEAGGVRPRRGGSSPEATKGAGGSPFHCGRMPIGVMQRA